MPRSGSIMAVWDWGAYHAELLRRTRTVPPLMQSVWNESANEADWLAPAQFPLPIYRLLPDEDGARKRSLLSEQPCDPRDDEGITAIALRQGIVEGLFRLSLIWSLVKQTPSERLRFFGMPGTDIEHPRVGYVHWKEIPTYTPFDPARKPCELSEVMARSLKRLSAGSSANVPTSRISIDRKRLPQTPEDEASAFPQVIVLDVTTRSADASRRIAYLKAMLNEGSTRFDLPPCEIVMLLGASDLTMGIIAGRAFGKDEDHVIYVDAPAARQELQTFCLGWERWRKTEGGPRRLLERAGHTLENSIHCLNKLDMEDPSNAVNPFWGRKRELSTKQATLDIMCTVIAMQSDARNTMAAPALARLCDRLLERTNYKQQHDLVCLLWAFLKARGFDNALRLADEVIVGATAFASCNRPSALTFFFGSDADAILQREFDRAEKNRGSKGYYLRACYVIMHENPLLSSIFRTIYIGDGPNGESRLQLMNEPLALGFLAQDACRHLIERTDGITEDMGVVTAEGVVGIIRSVGENYSVALSFLNPTQQISAKLGRKNAFGILSWDGKSANGALLTDIQQHIEINNGDTVYTSGHSAIFPADIPLGVVKESKLTSGLHKSAKVELFQDYTLLDYVFVVRNRDMVEIDSLSGLNKR